MNRIDPLPGGLMDQFLDDMLDGTDGKIIIHLLSTLSTLKSIQPIKLTHHNNSNYHETAGFDNYNDSDMALDKESVIALQLFIFSNITIFPNNGVEPPSTQISSHGLFRFHPQSFDKLLLSDVIFDLVVNKCCLPNLTKLVLLRHQSEHPQYPRIQFTPLLFPHKHFLQALPKLTELELRLLNGSAEDKQITDYLFPPFSAHHHSLKVLRLDDPLQQGHFGPSHFQSLISTITPSSFPALETLHLHHNVLCSDQKVKGLSEMLSRFDDAYNNNNNNNNNANDINNDNNNNNNNDEFVHDINHNTNRTPTNLPLPNTRLTINLNYKPILHRLGLSSPLSARRCVSELWDKNSQALLSRINNFDFLVENETDEIAFREIMKTSCFSHSTTSTTSTNTEMTDSLLSTTSSSTSSSSSSSTTPTSTTPKSFSLSTSMDPEIKYQLEYPIRSRIVHRDEYHDENNHCPWLMQLLAQKSPGLSSLETLNVPRCGFNDSCIQLLTHSPYLHNISTLILDANLNLTDQSVKYITSSDHMKNLTKISFTHTQTTIESLLYLLSPPCFKPEFINLNIGTVNESKINQLVQHFNTTTTSNTNGDNSFKKSFKNISLTLHTMNISLNNFQAFLTLTSLFNPIHTLTFEELIIWDEEEGESEVNNVFVTARQLQNFGNVPFAGGDFSFDDDIDVMTPTITPTPIQKKEEKYTAIIKAALEHQCNVVIGFKKKK